MVTKIKAEKIYKNVIEGYPQEIVSLFDYPNGWESMTAQQFRQSLQDDCDYFHQQYENEVKAEISRDFIISMEDFD